MKVTSFSALFTGGMHGNLGILIFTVLLLLLPNICWLVKAIKTHFYFLKFLQYPGLIIFTFSFFVFFLRQERWNSMDWRANYFQFALCSSFITNGLSLFVMRKSRSVLLKIVPLFMLLGLAVYSML